MAAKFDVFVDEDHSKLPTLYWLKVNFIKLALINLRHHSVTFGMYLLFNLINVWNKYL